MAYGEARARSLGMKSLFVLSTRTSHWFLERGFAEVDTARLPDKKQALYNYDRRSKVFLKEL
jgi:amino-acid N-acetyltransferase